MNKKDLIKILNGDIDWIDQVDVKDENCLFKNKTTILLKHVKNMLLRFLSGNITADELTKWAKFITLRLEYVTVPLDVSPINDVQEYDSICDYYTDMFYVIERLSTPEIDGEVNVESVMRYLKDLKKYENDQYASFWKISE